MSLWTKTHPLPVHPEVKGISSPVPTGRPSHSYPEESTSEVKSRGKTVDFGSRRTDPETFTT